MNPQNRSRLVLLLIALLFVVPISLAVLLHAIGWEPSRTRNYGTLLQPAVDLRDLELRRLDGSPYAWEPQQRRWRILVWPSDACARACITLIAGLDKVWQLQGRRADRLDVLWFGRLPEAASPFRRLVLMQPHAELFARLPQPEAGADGTLPVYLVDPSGFLALRYAPDFDLAGLREDIARMLK